MASGVLVALVLASTHPLFPIPQEKGVAPPSDAATTFQLHQPIRGLERMYRETFKGDPEVSFLRGHDDHGETLTILNTGKHIKWTKALLRGDDVLTTLTLTKVIEVTTEGPIEGKAPTAVAVFVPRSGQVEKQLQEIDADHQPAH